MTTTYRSQDKYAFLFTGPTSKGRFVKDIENVFHLLTEYYNYPAGNITVVCGSTKVTPSVPGATVLTITNADELRDALETFANKARGPAPGLSPDDWTTAVLYFTGGGCSDASGSKLIIDGESKCAKAATVDPAWLTTCLNTFENCHVNVVMQQSFSGGFLSALTGSTLSQWSFTHACSDTEDSFGNNSIGGYFTHGWTRGLKLESLPSGIYADELGSADESENRLISLEEAKEFAVQIDPRVTSSSTPGYAGAGGPQYLGLPAFLIRDSTPNYWESPDIYLTHPNHPSAPPGDLYIPDPLGATPPYNNTINVDVRNKGTHPVRAYSLGIELFKSGIGVTNEKDTVCDILPEGGILFPIDITDIGTPNDKKDTYQWNTPFYEGTTHECVRAEAKLLCSAVDFAWSVVANQFEAQRNTDEMEIIPLSQPLHLSQPLPFPDLQGFKEHTYGIQNPFDDPRTFILGFPEEYQEYKDIIELTWFEIVKGPDSEQIPLKVVDEPVSHIPFKLKAGEKKDILLHVEMKPEFAIEEGIKLPFEIAVDGEWPDTARTVSRAADLPTYALLGGFTVAIKKGSSTLVGTILDAKNKPVEGAKIFLRTVNDLQGAVVTTDKKGHYIFPDINPDLYHIQVETKTSSSKKETIVLPRGKEKKKKLHLTEKHPIAGNRVKVILDKIRIMDDHDPCIKGKKKLAFTSVIIPDNDNSKKQVTRLPPKGVYPMGGEPCQNEIRLEVTVFDGIVKNRSLSFDIYCKKKDFSEGDEESKRYHRVFFGDPETWYGQYSPSREYLSRKDVKDWALWYRIVRS